jgi:4-hydroxybenzoate polyprenyltransferase
MAGAQVFVGAAGAGELHVLFSPEVIAGACCIIFAVAVANTVNDVVDVGADSINRGDRPLPSGRLSPRAAWLLALACGATSCLASWSGPGGPLLALTLLTLSVTYSYVFKSTVLIGNLIVAAMAAFPLIYGAMIVDGSARTAWLGSTLIFLFMFTYEVLKTIRDIDADRAAGYVTVSTVVGRARSATLVRCCLTVYITAAIAWPLAVNVAWTYFAINIIGGVLPMAVSGFLRPLGRSPEAVQRMLTVMIITWVPGLVAICVAARSG